MRLLERDAYLRELEVALKDAVCGAGRLVLISGEAGIGKTSLVEQFVRGRGEVVRVLWGACDALFTPRPLSPLHDIAAQTNGRLLTLLNSDAQRTTIFSAALTELQARPAIVVFEDVHWADEATLDLLTFLGRRIARTAALLALTYRDDELGPQHPLRLVLGDLVTSPATRRLSLAPLSENAVRVLVGKRAIDTAALHRQTGGNPFFVTEALAGAGNGVPHTIRDAVLSRAARLSPSGQAVLQAAAVIGPRIEPWILADVTGVDAAVTEECLMSGMLLAQGEALAFRHELARQTILESISPSLKLVLHRKTLDAFKAPPTTQHDLIRLAHYAEAAHDREAVLAYAPAAARQAAGAGAHREAAALYELALRFANTLPAVEQAQLLEAYAQECDYIDYHLHGIEACRKAINIWRHLDNPLKQGELLTRMAHKLTGLGRDFEAQQCAQEAIALLEAHPSGCELAMAYRRQSFLDILYENHREAITWAEKSIAIAQPLHSQQIVLSAQNVIGMAWMALEYERGCQYLERNLQTAHDAGYESITAVAYANASWISVVLYHLQRAERYLTEGIAYTTERDLDRLRFYMTAWNAFLLLRRGQWSAATDLAEAVVRRPGISITSRVIALVTLGLCRARQGHPQAQAALDEALALSQDITSLHRIGLVRAARAEAAWLGGDHARVLTEACAVYDRAVSKRHPWFTGELAYWRQRAGDDVALPAWTAQPFALQIAGDWRVAADAWAQLGCPYEQARALADGDYDAQAQALTIFERLGARPAADSLRRTMRAGGAARIPRGPRPSTFANPFGLTTRQMDILRLLTQGLSNAEIAAELYISAKTVDHHVSAVLAKLDVPSREEAAALARRHLLFFPT
jgi:predicted ATPase/DNA-binding CsgD family transcriptional regulator